jgi:hypothetical protein
MAEVTAATFNDDGHWRVDVRGTISGEHVLKSYHLAAESKSDARMNALRKFSGEWDEVPFVCGVERYRSWRAYEPQPEGQCGVG